MSFVVRAFSFLNDETTEHAFSAAVMSVSFTWQEQIDENAASIASGGPRVITYDMAWLLFLLVLSVPLGLVVWALDVIR